MKKIIIPFLVFLMLLLCSCGVDAPKEDNKGEKDPTPVTDPTEEENDPVIDDPVFVFETLFNKTTVELEGKESISLRSLTTIDLDDVKFTLEREGIVEIKDGKIVPLSVGKVTLWGEYDYDSYDIEILVMPIVECDLCDQEEVVYVGEKTNIIIANYEGKISDFELIPTNDNVEIKGNEVRFVKPGDVDIAIVYKDDARLNSRLSFSVKKTKPILTADMLEAEVDDYVEFGVSNYASIKMFNIYCSDESILELDSDYYGFAKKPGKVTVTIKLKDDEAVSASIEVTVKNIEIKARYSYSRIIVGEEFTIDLYSYSSEDVFNFEIADETVVKKTGVKTYKALKVGETSLVVSLKEDPTTKLVVDLVVYPVEPIIQIGSNVLQIGQTSKIMLLNYLSTSDFDVVYSDNSLVDVEGDNFTCKREGNLVITVTKKSDSKITSSVSVEIIPVQPQIYLSSEYITVGGTSGIYVGNYDKIEENSLDDFNITIEGNDIVSLSNNVLTGLKVGVAKVKIASKVNPKAVGEIVINVTKTSKVLDEYNEPNEGVLLLSVKDNDSAYLNAGDFYQVLIDEATNRENYRWLSTNTLVAVVNDTGRVIAVGSGVAQIAAVNKHNNEVKGIITVTVYGIPNVDYAARLVRVATEELGYREGPNNDTKYGAWYNLNYEAWCAMFVSWCCNQAGISTDIVPKYCGCTAGMNWFIDRNQFQYRESGYIPKAGDIVFYRDRDVTSWTSTHTGIVYAATSTTLYTIEGNTSDMCAKRSYSLSSTYILGYGVPNYPAFNGEPATFTPGHPENGENHTTR